MVSRAFGRGGLMAILVAYTAFAGFPFLWVGTMSLRSTTKIAYNHYGWPSPAHWAKFRAAWIDSAFDTYFANSATVVIGSVAVISASRSTPGGPPVGARAGRVRSAAGGRRP